MEDNNNTFTVIDGGKSKRSGHKATGSGLTEKQERFIAGLADGMTNSEAYRAAYDTSGMQANTVHSEASKLACNPKIAARLNQVLAEKRAKHSMESDVRRERNADRVWRNVWRLAEGVHVPPAVQQSALALAAKMAGMLTDKVEIEQKGSDSKSIEAEIRERLQKLAG
jgi:phage terminase small subunit